MKVPKYLSSAIVLAIVGLFLYQNAPVFQTVLGFSLDLHIHEEVHWEMQLYAVLGLTALVGFAVGVLVVLRSYFGMRRLLAQERERRACAPPLESESPPAGGKAAGLSGSPEGQ